VGVKFVARIEGRADRQDRHFAHRFGKTRLGAYGCKKAQSRNAELWKMQHGRKWADQRALRIDCDNLRLGSRDDIDDRIMHVAKLGTEAFG
jgi:hypothetical protein